MVECKKTPLCKVGCKAAWWERFSCKGKLEGFCIWYLNLAQCLGTTKQSCFYHILFVCNRGTKSCIVVELRRAEVQSVYLITAMDIRHVRDQWITSIRPRGGPNQTILGWERQSDQEIFEVGSISGNIVLSTHNQPLNQCESFSCKGKLRGFGI